MRLPRSAGVLLHPTSLPGPEPIGVLGPEALHFVDFLASAAQGIWQVLPLGPPGPGDSPYAGSSAFAGSPLLISLPVLGHGPDTPNASRVDYGRVAAEKLARLRRAYEAAIGDARVRADVDRFADENSAWLNDFALFTAIKNAHGGAGWTQWPEGLARHDAGALEEFRRGHTD